MIQQTIYRPERSGYLDNQEPYDQYIDSNVTV